MSLRNQIIYRILLSTIGILLLAGTLSLWQARHAVEKEVASSLQLALQIIRLGISDQSLQNLPDRELFQTLPPTRHLSIHLQQANGELLAIQNDPPPNNPETLPPDWFIHAVTSDYPIAEHTLHKADGQILKLIITPRPLDEITEVWQESVTFFSILSLLIALSFIAIQLVFNQSLGAINIMVDTLRLIETGDYRPQLPGFSVLEFDKIASAINHMTTELLKAQQENQALTQHTLAIQEAERRQLSQDLHDELGQSLTAIKVMAAAATSPRANIGQISASIESICEHLMLVLRSMMQQLHPLSLSELGFRATLEDLVNVWQQRHPSLDWQLHCDDAIDDLPDTLSIQVFRIIQECLTNSVRHANANQIEIALTMTTTSPGQLSVLIRDDGEGCQLDRISSGFGLLGIKERIQSLHGQLQFASGSGQGMTISAKIPLP